MKKAAILLIAVFWLMGNPFAFAQVADSTKVDSLGIQNIKTDSLQAAIPEQKKEQPKPGQVTPWKERPALGAETVTNDSLLRWQIWPNWGDFQAYRREVLSFRQGSIGRLDAFHINGYQPNEQQLRLEGLPLNNPITGLVNYNWVPHRKIGRVAESFSGNYLSDIRIRDFYLVKPISYLNYDEAGGNFRNLEFMVAQNFTERTNLEISFWDRRGGGYYPNSNMEGSQVVARAYHHLNNKWLLRGLYVRNQLKGKEPFGYTIGDPAAFPFNEFTSSPVHSNANSKRTRWDLITGIYHRGDTTSAEDGGLELFTTKNEKKLRFPPDTLGWDVRTLGGRVFKSLQWQKLFLRGEVSSQFHSNQESLLLTENSWAELQGKTSLGYNFSELSELFGKAEITSRNDGAAGYDVTAGLKTTLLDRLKLNVSGSAFSFMPTMQALYWQAGSYAGNTALENEKGLSVFGKLEFELTPTITFGTSGRFKNSDNSAFLTSDSSFVNSGEINQLSGTAYFQFQNHRFEIESSGTAQQFSYANPGSAQAPLNHQDLILWLRNSAFVKGYVFNRAAFLKIGVKTLLSPFYYSARSYNTELGYWQGNSSYQKLPSFFRLDGELSARVRGIMVVIRWENALDGLGQAGYFESAGFPMPPRRLMVGIRAQFRN